MAAIQPLTAPGHDNLQGNQFGLLFHTAAENIGGGYSMDSFDATGIRARPSNRSSLLDCVGCATHVSTMLMEYLDAQKRSLQWCLSPRAVAGKARCAFASQIGRHTA